jgi:hypothetical protein
MNLKPNALRERQAKWDMAPRWVKCLNLFLLLQYRMCIAIRANVWKRPFDYSLYTLASPAKRVTMHAAHPTTFWKGRLSVQSVVNPI